jgi:exonuclease III
LKLSINDSVLITGAIYGPNETDQNFFLRLKNDIESLGTRNVILGGDWNATPSCDEVQFNIDTLNMRNVPNMRHSEYIRDLCNDLDLIEPFRYKFPNKKEYTFIPRSVLSTNRSRIDYFW